MAAAPRAPALLHACQALLHCQRAICLLVLAVLATPAALMLVYQLGAARSLAGEAGAGVQQAILPSARGRAVRNSLNDLDRVLRQASLAAGASSAERRLVLATALPCHSAGCQLVLRVFIASLRQVGDGLVERLVVLVPAGAAALAACQQRHSLCLLVEPPAPLPAGRQPEPVIAGGLGGGQRRLLSGDSSGLAAGAHASVAEPVVGAEQDAQASPADSVQPAQLPDDDITGAARLGVAQVRVLRDMVLLGYDVLWAHPATAWLASPLPALQAAAADVQVSTGVWDQRQGRLQQVGGLGVVLVRSRRRQTLAFMDHWASAAAGQRQLAGQASEGGGLLEALALTRGQHPNLTLARLDPAAWPAGCGPPAQQAAAPMDCCAQPAAAGEGWLLWQPACAAPPQHLARLTFAVAAAVHAKPARTHARRAARLLS